MKITLIVRLYIIILAIYTGIRTFDFIFNQLPKGLNSAAAYGMALIFLFTTEVGMFLWHEISNKHCTTDTQRSISIAFTWIDFVASLAAGIADMILWQTLTDYTIDPIFARFLIIGMPVALATNVMAGLLFLSNDGDTILRTEEQMVAFEGKKLAIENIRRNKKALAAKIAPEIERQIESNLLGKATNIDSIEELANRIDNELVIKPAISQNGKKSMTSQNGNIDESARNFQQR